MAELIHTAGRMSKGEAAPAEARIAATVVGSICIEAVLMTTSRHSSSEASLPESGHAAGRPDAHRRRGVAQTEEVRPHV
jgi:hypothetical protein